jgi:hypothetical protein
MAVAPPAPLPADPPVPPDPEAFAEAAGIDPTPQDVAEYERRLDEAARPDGASSDGASSGGTSSEGEPEPVSEPTD